jgi:hypothetical protein
MPDPTLKQVIAFIAAAVQSAYLEGCEAGYIMATTQPEEPMTFTHHRSTLALQTWDVSKAKQFTKVL